MKPTKNIECVTKNTRKSKFRTEEERRQATLESKRRWAQKNSSKNKDEVLPELELFEVHKTPDGKMTSIYRPKKDGSDGIPTQEIKVLKERLKELEKENLSVKEKLLKKENAIESLTKEIAFLKDSLEQKKKYEESKPIVSIYRVEEEDESIDVCSEYFSSDEDEKQIVKKQFSEDDIRSYAERRKKGGKNFKHDLDIEEIIADRNRKITD